MALWTLFALAVAQRCWNAANVQPLTGFDAPGHMGYVLTILRDHRLPHPTAGWSTFHPPLYYLMASAVWAVLEPLGPRAVLLGVRGLAVVFGLAMALVAYHIVRRLGAVRDVALVAAALVLFVPCAQMAATMEGNEAFAAGVVALGLPPLLMLQRDPRDVRVALVVGLLAGLAAISKFTGLALVVACAVPFLRRDLDRAMVRTLLALGVVFVVVAGPVYGRNVLLAGSPFPMTRTREPMATAERAQIIRPRRLTDYVTVHVDNFVRPSVFHVPGRPAGYRNRNAAMTSVPGLLYASLWYDPFAHRIPLRHHRDGVLSGPVLLALGLMPTLLVIAGVFVATGATVASRLRAPDAPLVVLAVAGTALFVLHTWVAQSTASVKGSYLLPLAPAAATFFARAVALLSGPARVVALALSLTAAVAGGVVFTEGVLFRSDPPMGPWAAWGRRLPESHILEALRYLIPPPE